MSKLATDRGAAKGSPGCEAATSNTPRTVNVTTPPRQALCVARQAVPARAGLAVAVSARLGDGYPVVDRWQRHCLSVA